MRLLLSFLFLLPALVYAQGPAAQYIDVVYPYDQDAVSGTVITYEYGVRVVIVQENGITKDFDWAEVKRVNFQLDKNRETALAQPAEKEEEVDPTTAMETRRPNRKFRHQLTGSLNFGSQVQDFGQFFVNNSPVLGIGVGYHLIKPLGRLNVGAGLDLSLMSHQLQEKVLAGTVQVDYPFGRGRLRPFVRIEGGMTYPFGAGAGSGSVTERSISPLYHPSVGVEIGRESGPWNRLVVDLGYRFLTNRFTITDANLDVIERRVEYRRLVLRAGIRF